MGDRIKSGKGPESRVDRTATPRREAKVALAGRGNLHRGGGIAGTENDPDLALPLFRRALRSHIPTNRSLAAATLALIDRPWSLRELTTVLVESDDQEATSECLGSSRVDLQACKLEYSIVSPK